MSRNKKPPPIGSAGGLSNFIIAGSDDVRGVKETGSGCQRPSNSPASAPSPAILSTAPSVPTRAPIVHSGLGARPCSGDLPILALTGRWRIAHDGRLQWVLQIREGRHWQGHRFHVERDGLARSIREFCDPVDPAVLAVIADRPTRCCPSFVPAPARDGAV